MTVNPAGRAAAHACRALCRMCNCVKRIVHTELHRAYTVSPLAQHAALKKDLQYVTAIVSFRGYPAPQHSITDRARQSVLEHVGQLSMQQRSRLLDALRMQRVALNAAQVYGSVSTDGRKLMLADGTIEADLSGNMLLQKSERQPNAAAYVSASAGSNHAVHQTASGDSGQSAQPVALGEERQADAGDAGPWQYHSFDGFTHEEWLSWYRCSVHQAQVRIAGSLFLYHLCCLSSPSAGSRFVHMRDKVKVPVCGCTQSATMSYTLNVVIRCSAALHAVSPQAPNKMAMNRR